jgi:hypothetical protein
MNYKEAKNDFLNFVNSSDNKHTLFELHTAFIVEKMKMDKYFSKFLDENEKAMGECETFDNESWHIYKNKLKEYNEIDDFIKRSNYYLNKNV